MDPHAVLKRAAKIEYAVVRLPLQVVDEQVVQRYLDESSPARQSFQRALRTFDDVVGQWLWERPVDVSRDPDDEQPFSFVDDPAEADEDDPAQTDESPAPARDDPAPHLTSDEVERIDTLTDELVEHQQTETFAGELAEDDELRQVQAELEARRLVEEQDE